MSATQIRVLQIGIGALGRSITRYLVPRPNMRIVAAVDNDADLAGKDLGQVCSLDALGITVCSSLQEALRQENADVAVLATVSDLRRIVPQLEEVMEQGLPAVTTCEELVFPWHSALETAARLDQLAKKQGVAVLATGVNPGFLMDILPLSLTAISQKVDAIRVRRIQDASSRRLPFQRKIGAGLSLEEFEDRKRQGILRHVGLTESMHMIAWRLGWELDRTEDIISPVVAETSIATGSVHIEPGTVAGVQQIGRAFAGAEEKVTLLFRASLGEPNPEDTLEILGEPHVVSTIPGGVHGDVATCAITLNAIARVLRAEPGLKTMADIPPVSCFR